MVKTYEPGNLSGLPPFWGSNRRYFTFAWTASEPLKDQEVLVRNLAMSVDPYMRGRRNEVKAGDVIFISGIVIVVLAATLFSTFSLTIACIVRTRERFMGWRAAAAALV